MRVLVVVVLLVQWPFRLACMACREQQKGGSYPAQHHA